MVIFNYSPPVTDEALQTYENIPESIYIGSAIGRSLAQESMPCLCKYESELDDPLNACGNDNTCINRMMFMECVVQDCPCGHLCRNRRFQLAQYASVDVIKTENKGYGLRALKHLPKNSFVMEYIGEVIPQSEFIRRTKEYDAEGYKHYYFMTLKNDQIIDATKKGCLARFMNHSCNPNCVTQKWVIGKKMRIGLFTSRDITAGEELTFDYKFERYGATAQSCYCGEINCKGYIGTTEEKAVNTENTYSSSSSDDSDEEDEYIDIEDTDDTKFRNDTSLKPLQDPHNVRFFVKRMLNSVGKPRLVNKLLVRLLLTNANNTQGRDVLKTIVKLHGLKMLKFWLGEWKHDESIVTKVLKVLDKLPLANRNGLDDCRLLEIVEKFVIYENEEIRELSQQLLDKWSDLKSVYRIPKRAHIDYVEEDEHHDNEHVEEDETESNASVTNDSIKKQYLKSYYESKRKRRRTKYETTREYFDPDNDYFEYFSMNTLPEEIVQKTQLLYQAKRLYVKANKKTSAQLPELILPATPDTPIPNNSIDNSNNDHTHENAAQVQTNSYYYPPMNNDYYHHQNPYSPWQIAVTEDGYTYYYNTLTQQTQWQVPQEILEQFAPPPPPPPPRSTQTEPLSSPPPPPPSEPSHLLTPASADDIYLNDVDLKREVGGVVTKYLSSRHQKLWKGDKRLFKDLARKMTHHIVHKEVQSGRKIKSIHSGLRSKIEKFIDAYGTEYVTKLQ